MEIHDLFKDLEDGKRLIKLLEIISGEKLGKPNQGRLKVHKIENVNKALSFIQTKVKLESIGAEDIVAGTPNLILGLIWTIILRFQIQDIEFEVEDESKEKRSAKEALLLWCQRKTAGYPGVKVSDFSTSWRNGLAFNALVHSQRPDLFDFNSLKPHEHIFNLNHAFEMAQRNLGISGLLDSEDIDVDRPDEKSVITYVSSFYHTFAKMKNEAVGGKRVGKIIGFMLEIDKMINLYESQIDEMLYWIQKKIKEHYDFVFPNSLDAIKSLMLTFNKGYMTIEKPPKCKQKSMLTAHFYNINMKLNAQGHPKYSPADGRTINDLETQWSRLEKAEHERDSALKKELNRQEQLEQLYAKFDKKAKLREDWLSEMAHILSSSTLVTSQIDATFRKQEAIGTDMQARSDRFTLLDQLAKNLINEDYFFKETVRKRNQQIQVTYLSLLEQYEKRKATLSNFQELELLFQEMQSLKNEMLELETCFQSKEYGEYLLAVEDLLTKHTLLESQKAGIMQHLKSINRRAQQFTRPVSSDNSNTSLVSSESKLVKEKLDALNKAFDLINVLCSERRKYLEERRCLHKFMEEADEESMWLQEKLQMVKSKDAGHDLNSTQLLITKHEQLEDELKFRKPHIDKIIEQSGEQLIKSQVYSTKEIEKLKTRCDSLKAMFESLKEAAIHRRTLLEDSFSSQQYFADANEAESWMKDKMAIVVSSVSDDSSESSKLDEASAQALLQRHVRVQEEIKAYEPEIRRLEEITNVLAGKRRFSSIPADMRHKFMKNQQKRINDNDLETDDNDDEDYLSSDTLDKSSDFETETETLEVKVACVKALYSYQSKTFSLQRGEILELKEKSNEEWWLVENTLGKAGFAPANYLKELGVQNVTKQQQQKQQIIKNNKSVSSVLLKKDKKSSLRRKTTSIQPRQLQHLGSENLQKRQVEINFFYSQLFNASIDKRKYLEGSIAFYKWYRHYNELDKWIKDKQQSLSIEKEENSLLDNPDGAKRRYQAFNTDFLANQNDFNSLEKLADDLKRTNSTNPMTNMSYAQIQQKQTELNYQWLKLVELKKYWDNSVKAIECIDQFNVSFAEVNDLLNEKLSKPSNTNLDESNDVKSVRALQAKQDKIERELVSLEANVTEMRKTAEEVCKYFPQEKKNVQRKLEMIDELWFRLRNDVKTRKAKLDEKHGLQRFENEVNDFNGFCARLKQMLNELESPHDLKQCEEMQKKYNDIEQEFNNEITFKFNDLKQLSQTQMAKRGVIGSVDKINKQLSQVAQERTELAELVADKRKYLDDYHKYLKFKQDANSFELLMQDQEAYLQYEDLGSSLTNVEALMKRHEDFLAKLMAQDEKMKNLNEQFTKLTVINNNKHFATQETDKILKLLGQKREHLKLIALERKQKLKQSKEFFEFKNQCDDLNSWLNDRRRKCLTIQLDDNELNNNNSSNNSILIEKYSNKHEALEKELNANRVRLESLKTTESANLIKNDELNSLINQVELNWNNLEQEAKLRGKKLAETKMSANLTSYLNDIDMRMKNLEQSLNKNYNLNDLRSVKEALKQNNDLKKQVSVELDLVSDFTKSDSKLLAAKDMNNKSSIEAAIKEYANKFKALNPYLEQKQKELEFHLVLQQLLFDTDEELKWIEQSRQQIGIIFAVLPKTLFEAQNLTRKQTDLERSIQMNHKPTIEKLIEQSDDLLSKSNDANELKLKKQQLESEWTQLTQLNEQKKLLLNDCLNEQEKLEKINQISLGLLDKMPVLTHIQSEIPILKDEIHLNKNSSRLSQLELDLNGFKKMLNEIEQELKINKEETTLAVNDKLNETNTQINEMQSQIEDSKQKLEMKQSAIEFEREATDLIQWLNEKRQKLIQSDSDYGQDYEHLLQLQAKFNALKDEIKVFEEPRLERIRMLSTELLNAKSPESKQIRKRWDDIKVLRDLLNQEIQSRDIILNSAAEIHCFNRDVQDLLRRINDKELSFSTDLGRDTQSCEQLKRKHEIFIEELTALKVQLQDLNKQSETLRHLHPGDTAESIAAETDELIDQFRSLWLKTEKRTKELKQSSDYFKFISYVRDVNEWIMQTEQTLRSPLLHLNDLFSVTQEKQDHDSLSFEMTQRDDIFKELDDMCILLTNKQNHPQRREILSQTNQAMTCRENLFRLWKLKSELLENYYDCHAFYRECGQLITILNSQELLLNNAINDSTLQLSQQIILNVDVLESQMKTHQNLEKKIEKQKLDKSYELERLAASLIERESKRLEDEDSEFKDSNELARLEQTLASLLKKQNDVLELCHKRVRQLSEMLRVFKLCRDIDEFEVWVDDRIRFARNLNHSSALLTSEKVKLFQKQKTLTNEIDTNSDRFNDLVAVRGKEKLESKPTIELRNKLLSSLTSKWNQLTYECAERAKEFEEAKDILEFNDQLEKEEEWLKEKELMLHNGDLGHDFEHCTQLMKKADEALSPLNELKLKEVIAMGDKLVSLGRTERDVVLDKKNRLISRYEQMRSGVSIYKNKLVLALEMHSLTRDYDELKHRISEKTMLLKQGTDNNNSEFTRATLDSVQIAQTKTIDLESDTKAIRQKLTKLNAETLDFLQKIEQKNEVTSSLDNQMISIESDLKNLEETLQARKKSLDSDLAFQKFMVEYRELKSWTSDIMNRIQQQTEPSTLSEAETALNLHMERRTEIDGKTHRFIDIQQMARSRELNDVQKLIKEMNDLQHQLELKSDSQLKYLEECFAYQELRESWKQLDTWQTQTEMQLKSTDLGDSVLVVKSLITKHENIESSIKSQMAPGAAFDSIEKRALDMIKNKSIHSKQIQSLIIIDLQSKRKQLEVLCSSRRKNLDDSLLFQDFLLNYYEAIQWIKEKTVIAIDKTYLELTNLLTKIQRHQAFMSDLKKSGQKRVEDLHKEAENLIASRHQTTDEIEEYIKDLDSQWNALKAAAEAKKKCLEDAHKYVLFTRLCNDLLNWTDEVEQQLSTDDNGHDLSSCKMLLLRHEALTRQVASQQEKLNEIDTIIYNNLENFMFSKMREQAESVRRQYQELNEPCLIRKENLEESLCLFTILHDLEDSQKFVLEKQPLVCIEDLGANLDETLKLNRKHTQLEQELQAHAPLIQVALKTTRQLIERQHYAHMQLSTKLIDLENKWKMLKQQSELRSIKLKDAIEVQKYYSDVDDLLTWLKEKQPELQSTDYGKDDLTSLSCLKKLEALTYDLKTNQLAKLNALGQQAIQLQLLTNTNSSFDNKKTIARKQSELEHLFNNMCTFGNEREQHIKIMLKIFEFERECEANMNWFKDEQVIAASQDFGSDLEHAESLLKKFTEFQNDLVKNVDRIERIDEMAQQLCENKYTPDAYIEKIDEKCSQLNDLWKTLNTLAEVRRQTLEGAIEVHAFDKDCDDLITWSAEKEAFLDQDDFGYELATAVFTLSKQQESMENEMTALKEELDRLNSESARLCEQYPETRDHIETRLSDADMAYNELFKQLVSRNEKIQQSQTLFLLSTEFNELNEWLRDMLLKITSSDISTATTTSTTTIGEVNSAELMIKRHRELKIEIDMQQAKTQKFILKAQEFSAVNSEIKNKLDVIHSASKILLETWQSRIDLYEQNLEYNKLYREIKLLDAWLSSKDSYVNTDLLGDSLVSVDGLIKQHVDFERMLNAMENRFENLKKENRLEKTLKELKQRELEHKKQSDAQLVEEKKKEAERKKKFEKRRQDDRRRTQEIISIVNAPPNNNSNGHLPVVLLVNGNSETNLTNKDENTSTTPSVSNRNSALINEQHLPIINSNATSTVVGGGGLKARKDRNRTRSIRDRYKLPLRLPQPSIKDYLMRKQEYQKGGQRAPIREYASFYTTIHGNLMCFFANEKDYNDLNAISQPLNLFKCNLNQLEDATLQRNVLHLETTDGAEYLFDAAGNENSQDNLQLWCDLIIEASSKSIIIKYR